MSLTAHFGEHYNARGLTPEAMADSFVASRQFWSVSAHGNSVLLGPRGSGKTTLLRMLDPRGLNRWLAHSNSVPPEGWSVPQYVGIFVPIDTAWVSSLTNAVAGDEQGERDRLYLTIYSLSVARCLVDVMRWRLSDITADAQRLRVDRRIETELARHLGEIFVVGTSMRSLLELHIELTKRILALPGLWKDAVEAQRRVMIAGLENPLASTAAACDVFNALANEPGRRWSLLCDELEIAPPAIRKLLFSGLRAVPSPLFLKMALTPKEQIGTSDDSEPPLPANDYEVIPLSYPTREEGAPEKEREEFCVALWKSLVEEHGGDLAPVLSDPFSAFEDPSGASRKASTARDSQDLDAKFGSIFRSLAKKDESFREYLEKKQVNIEDLDKNDQLKRDSVIRKVRPIVEIRDHNLRLNSGGELVRVPRRGANLYCGAKRIFAVSEGHPRWLKYTLGAMLTRAVLSHPHVRLTDQNRELRYAVQRTEARLKALPVDQVSPEDLVRRLGEFFAGQVLDGAFRADPVLSFVVDSNVAEGIEDAVAKALYLGALVPLQRDVSDLFTKGVRGRRFRLSNWLAPAFALPLMTGKAINLSSILSRERKGHVAPINQMQFPLGLGE